MKRIIKLVMTTLLSAVTGSMLLAQTQVKVTGVVTSADDGMPMIGVAVMSGPGN